MRYRFIRDEDFPNCLELIHNSLADRLDIRSKMPEIWSRLRQQGSLIGAIIEDLARPPSEVIQAVYLAVFVSDEYIDGVLSAPQPRIILDLYERILAGRSPVLDPEQIRRANSAGGLNCLMLHTGIRSNGEAVMHRRLAESLRDVCVLLHAGYHNRLVVEEVVGTRAKQAMLQSGFRLVTDFAGHPALGDCPHPDDHPYLFVVSDEGQSPGIVSGVSFYFTDAQPRFQFAPVQQQVLLHALFNESDDEIGQSLDISVETVRKHWRSIYRHVMEIDPVFFPGCRPDGDARGPEKRRYLLSHLRLHLDEVRPRLHTRKRKHAD